MTAPDYQRLTMAQTIENLDLARYALSTAEGVVREVITRNDSISGARYALLREQQERIASAKEILKDLASGLSHEALLWQE